MANNTQRTTSLQRRLNTRLQTNPAFVELAKAVDRVVRKTVTTPRDELANIRDTRRHHRGDWITLPDGRRAIVNHIAVREDGQVGVHSQVPNTSETFEVVLPSNLQDRDVLINNARYHGFNYFSDTLSTEDYARIVDYIEQFWPESGTSSYYKFMGFIKKVKLYADTLWTTEEGMEDDDDYPFLETNEGQYIPVYNGGPHYPTSHVQLRYDRIQFPDTNEFDLFQLFYLLAPIHLVLERIVSDIEGGTLYLETAAVGSIALYESGMSDFNTLQHPQVTTTIQTVDGSLSLFETGMLSLPRRRYLPVQNIDLIRAAPIANLSVSDWLWAYTGSHPLSEFRTIGGYGYKSDRTPRSLGRLGGLPYGGSKRGSKLGSIGYEDGPFLQPDNRVPVNRAPNGPQAPDQSFSLVGGLQFGAYLAEIVAGIQSASVQILQNGKLLAEYDSRESTRIYYQGGYIGVYIPPEFMPAGWTGDVFQYVISVRRNYGSTRVMEGTVTFKPVAVNRPIVLTNDLKFNLAISQNGTAINAAQYDFAMKIERAGGESAVLKTDNAALTTNANSILGSVPLPGVVLNQGGFNYQLFWRRKKERITNYNYIKIFEGAVQLAA